MERNKSRKWRIASCDVKVLWRYRICHQDQKRRRNGWFVDQEINREIFALSPMLWFCWCLMRHEFWPSLSQLHVCWGVHEVFLDSLRSKKGCVCWSHSFKACINCHSYLAIYFHKVYGNLVPSRPLSLCQNWLKLANGLKNYFLWDWEGADRLTPREHNCLHLMSVGSQPKNLSKLII